MTAAPRLKSEFFIKAYVRRVTSAGAQAFVVRHGDDQAGGLLIKISDLAGAAILLEPVTGPDGARRWMKVTGPHPVPDGDAEAQIAKRRGRDPDLWVIEVEDRAARHFLDDPVD